MSIREGARREETREQCKVREGRGTMTRRGSEKRARQRGEGVEKE